MTREREYIPIEALPEEERAKIEALEKKTDKIYGLRTELAYFYRKYRRYLPEQEVKGKVRRMRLEDLSRFVHEGGKLEEIIPFERISAEVERLDKTQKEKELLKKWRRLQIINAFKSAVRSFNELQLKGGVWRERDLTAEEKEIKDYYEMRWGELGRAARRFDEIRAKAEELEVLKDIAHSDPEFLPHPEDIDTLEQAYTKLFEERRKLTEESPEAYLLSYGQQLKEAKEIFDVKGTIVETPYVKAKMDRIMDLINQGRPVFIHGELGTGKTELAKHLARKELSKAHLSRWEKTNPPPIDPEERKKWEARRSEEAEALIISGHRGIEIEQILAARAIERKEAPVPEEQVKEIDARWENFSNSEDFRKAIKNKSPEDIERLKNSFYQAYLEHFRSPVETKVVLAPVLQAMKEGRPVIIDEINAIPHHVLIVLNELLLSKPGDMVRTPFPGEEPFEIQEGFSIIATGNYKPEDSLLYPGRSPLDAAFLSRFGIVSYDYLPMQRTLEPRGLTSEKQREWRMQNELYQMIVTRLLNDDLSATLPEGSFEKIKKLCVVARQLQDIFSGRPGEWYAKVGLGKVKPTDILKENVLSIRHLLPILDQWKADGFRRELDDYIFLEYVERSNARPEEKYNIYRILKIQGDLFPDEKGWPKTDEKDKILSYPIEKIMYQKKHGMRVPLPDRKVRLRTYSPKEVIEELFGPAPVRKVVPEEFLEREEALTPEELGEESLERARILEALREILEKLKEGGYPKRSKILPQ